MFILQLVNSFDNQGGRERFIYDFSRALGARGHGTLLACLSAERLTGWGEAPCPPVCLLADDSADALAATVAALAPDLVVWHTSAQLAPAVAGWTFTVPVVAVVHTALTCPADSRLFRTPLAPCVAPAGPGCFGLWQERSCGVWRTEDEVRAAIAVALTVPGSLNRCEAVYVPSEAIGDAIVRDGVQRSRVVRYDPTLGAWEAIARVPLQLPRPDAPLRLAFAGRLDPYKGLMHLLMALRLLREAGCTATLEVAGDGWFASALVAETARLELTGCVRFIGRLAGRAMADWYARADIVVVPSLWLEAAALVVPEARAAGKPVVVFDAGGLSEWQHRFSGIFVAAHGDAAALAREILVAAGRAAPLQQVARAPLAPGVELVAELDQWATSLRTGP